MAVVTWCSWCSIPAQPDLRFHPGGQVGHIVGDLFPVLPQYVQRCKHRHVCLVNAGHLLHPLLLDVCDLGAEGEGDGQG